jgi:predicted AAA+ superfamily ATPase
MYSRLLKLPFTGNKSFFLFGPRGTGKTTWIKQHLNNALYLDLLENRLYHRLLKDPQYLEKLIPPNFTDWVILDEIQKIPPLLNEVHRLIESKKIKFILTGSSARSLRRKGVNLLGGRALVYHLYPLTAIELNADFDLAKALQYGNLAAITQESDPEKYLAAYIDTYMREEVLQEGLTRNISDFANFLEVATFSQGAQINMSEIAREVGINQKVVQSYFNILEDMLLSYELPAFTKRAKRRLSMRPKFYYFDVGVYRHLRPTGPFDVPEEIGGIALESLFFQELKAINDYFDLGYKLYFWRTSTGLEVDFVAYGKHGLKAFEIKRTKNLNNKDLHTLQAFAQDYPESELFIIYGGDRKEYYGDICAIPFQEALMNLPDLLNKQGKPTKKGTINP